MKVLHYMALFLAFGMFASCSPLGSGIEEKPGNAGNIVVTLGAHNPNSSRTALPSEKDGAKDFCDIVLYGSKSGGMTQLASWKTYDNIASDETAITVADGSWNFRLTAKRYGVLFSQTLSGVTVRSTTQTKLQFTNMQVDAANTGKNGAIEAKLYIYMSSNAAYVSAKLDDGEESEKEPCNISIYGGLYTYVAENVAQGNHVVTVFVYNFDKVLLLTIPFYANVIPGYKSTMEESFSLQTVSKPSSGTGHTVTYKANYPSGTAGDFAQEYFEGCSILDARGIGFAYSTGGRRFAYWTTDAAGNGTKYYAGDTPQFTADTTLYAQWKVFSNVVYCLNPLDSKKENETYNQQYDSDSRLVAIDTTNFSQKMSGYAFCGWDTNPDGTGTRYAPNDKPALQEDVLLYAQWCRKPYSDYYQIEYEREWYALFRAPTSLVDAFSATIKLYANTSFSGADITTVTRAKAFSGKFDGQGATLSDLTQPLFTTVSGTVSNLNIASSTISGSGAIAETCAAGGQISSCSVAPTVSVTGASSDKFVGGIVGTNNGTFSSCKMNGSVSASTMGVYVGGIVGKNAGTVSSPTVTSATVTASSYAYGAAGVAGYNTGSVTDATVTQCKITGSTTYAYVNEVAIGLSSTATAKSVSDNTLTGTSNVVCTNATATISATNSEANFYKTFSTVARSGAVGLTVSANKGNATVFLYKGTNEINTVPDKNTTATSAGALLFSGFDKIDSASVTYKDQCTLSSTSYNRDYIMRIYNSKWALFGSGSITVTYSIELE